MLVLLIVFMVTAPLLTVGVQVDLPESSADSLPEEQEPLTLTINSKGEIFIQESKVEIDNVIDKIIAVSKKRTALWEENRANMNYLSMDGDFFIGILSFFS